jgi:hypothetical protein
MKAFCFFIAVFGWANFSLAAPLNLSGLYKPSGQVLALMRETVDLVDLRQVGAQAKWDQLVKNGAHCQVPRLNIVKCSTLLSASAVPASSLQVLRAQNASLSIQFGQVLGSAQIVRKSDLVIEWAVPQKVVWSLGQAGGVGDQYRWIEMQSGVQKIVLPGSLQNLWLNVDEGKFLRLYSAHRIQESASRWHEDSAEVVLR